MELIWDNISDVAMHWADKRPDAPALYEGHATLTWRELAEHVRAAAYEFNRRGIKEDDPVGIVLGSSSELIIAWLAVLRLGAIPVVGSARLNADALKELAKTFGLAA